MFQKLVQCCIQVYVMMMICRLHNNRDDAHWWKMKHPSHSRVLLSMFYHLKRLIINYKKIDRSSSFLSLCSILFIFHAINLDLIMFPFVLIHLTIRSLTTSVKIPQVQKFSLLILMSFIWYFIVRREEIEKNLHRV